MITFLVLINRSTRGRSAVRYESWNGEWRERDDRKPGNSLTTKWRHKLTRADYLRENIKWTLNYHAGRQGKDFSLDRKWLLYWSNNKRETFKKKIKRSDNARKKTLNKRRNPVR